MSYIEDARLMEANKADLVAALKEIFPEHPITMQTSLEDIAKYMQWSVGLLSLDLATVNVVTNEQEFYDYDTWQSMTANQRGNRKQCGIRLRAEGRELIIAKSSLGSLTWGPTNIDVVGLRDYETPKGMLDDWDGLGNTEKIAAQAQTSGVAFNAGQRCWEWKAAKLATDGYDDPQQWYLPSIAELNLIYKYILQINSALAKFAFAQLPLNDHYSSTEANTNNAWRYNLSSGVVGCNAPKNNSYTVRPCSSVLVPAI